MYFESRPISFQQLLNSQSIWEWDEVRRSPTKSLNLALLHSVCLVTNNRINLPPGLLEISSPLFATWPRKLPNNCAEWKIYLKLIYRETHLNLFLIRIKIQLLVIPFGVFPDSGSSLLCLISTSVVPRKLLPRSVCSVRRRRRWSRRRKYYL